MRALASNEADLQGAISEDARVMAIFDTALAGNAQGLHGALAEAPRTIDNTNAYLANGSQIFGQLGTEVPQIDQVFDRLASAFSATQDGTNNHMWRVYCVGAAGATDVKSVLDANTPCLQAK
jgi:hypothetical protein